MPKICDFLEKLTDINAGMTCSSIIGKEKLFSNEDWRLCKVKKYLPYLTEAGSLPGESELEAELCICASYYGAAPITTLSAGKKTAEQ